MIFKEIAMIRKLCILILAFLPVVPLMAQPEKAEEGKKPLPFAPQKGQWQVSLVLGNGSFFSQFDGMNYLLPEHGATSVGLPSDGGTEHQSGDPGLFLNLGTLGENSILNVAGVQAKYFLSSRWSLTMLFSMNVNLTPKKDYVEGDMEVEDMPIPSYKYVEGRMSNSWMANVGSDYYFRTKNERISPYLGLTGGFRMARLETHLPATGEVVTDPGTDEETPIEVFRPSHRAGQIWGAVGALVAGVDFSVAKGFVLGIEVQPASYQYSRIQIKPAGMAPYEVGHHNIKAFAMPSLKLGFRF